MKKYHRKNSPNERKSQKPSYKESGRKASDEKEIKKMATLIFMDRKRRGRM